MIPMEMESFDKDGEKLSFTLTVPVDDEVRVNIGTYLSSEWKKLGVDCTMSALGWDAIDITKCESFLLGWEVRLMQTMILLSSLYNRKRR